MFVVPKPRGEGHGFELTQEAGADGGAPAAGRWRAARSTPSATAACTPTRSPSTTGSSPTTTSSAARTAWARASTCRWPGFENGRLQTAARAIGVMQAAYEDARQYALDRIGVRPADRRVPAHQGQARPHGGHHPGRPPVRLRRGPADGQGRGHARGGDGQGLRLQGRRVGHPRGHADPRRLRLRRGVRGQPLLRRRPGAVDLRGRRRDPLPQGHRPPPGRAAKA